MKYISIKGVLAGIVATIIVGIPNGYLQDYYFISIYNDVMPGVNLSSKEEMQQLIYKFALHPLTIAFSVITTLITVGIPSYITALLSNRAFIVNSSIIGLAVVIFYSLFLGEFIINYPVIYTVSVVFTLSVSCVAGYIRQAQVKALTRPINVDR